MDVLLLDQQTHNSRSKSSDHSMLTRRHSTGHKRFLSSHGSHTCKRVVPYLCAELDTPLTNACCFNVAYKASFTNLGHCAPYLWANWMVGSHVRHNFALDSFLVFELSISRSSLTLVVGTGGSNSLLWQRSTKHTMTLVGLPTTIR